MTETSPPPATGTEDKKGLPVWAWVAIGCGGLIVVGFMAFAALGFFAVKKGAELAKEATGVESFDEFKSSLQDNPAKTYAEMMVRMNPELEMIESDDSAGTITFKNTKTGEVATFNYDDIAEGKFSMTTEEGEFSVDASQADGGGGVVMTGPEGETRIGASASLDDVPDWVPLYPDAAEMVSTYSTRAGDTLAGSVSARTSDSAREVVEHFVEWFEDNGWEVTSQSTSSARGSTYGGVTGQLSEEGWTVNIGAIEQEGETQVTVNYNETTS